MYPDYYDIIKKPLDLKTVAQKLLASSYTSLGQLEADLLLMMDNAKKYNDPKSYIYKNANKLKTLIKETCKELGSLLRANKLYTSAKTHDKKRKLLEDISEWKSVEEQLADQAAAPPVEAVKEEDEEPQEDESEDEDDEEEESEDEEVDVNKSGKQNI